jgi:malonyl-CoA O-methyltransferase
MSGDAGLARRFSRAAADYDRLTEVQRLVAERLAGLLDPLPAPAEILEIGCGTGHFTRILRGRFPAARIRAIDIAAGMIARARAAVPGAAVTWIVADARRDLPRAEFGLIAGSSSLHWLAPLEPLFARLHRRLLPGGHLVFALMREGSLRELREARRRAAPHKEPAARLVATTDVTRALDGAGFVLEALQDQVSVQRHRDAATFLAELRRQGVTGGEFSRGPAPLTRGEIRALIADYDASFPHPDGGVRSTYEVLHVRARKPG